MDTKTTSKSSKTAVLTSAPKATAKVLSKKGASKKATPSQEQIALRAYFISERRQQLGWDGDPVSDWIDAEQQLKAEQE